MRRTLLWLSLTALGLGAGLSGCTKPDSVELGQQCKHPDECKDPSDTCMNIAGATMCTLACTATELCPDDYACALTDKANRTGYCVADSRIGSHIATIKPKRSAKRKARLKARRDRKAKAKAEAEAEDN